MNFIIEFLPKLENSSELVYVVRAQNGYPIAVCESLDDAYKVLVDKSKDFIKTIKNGVKKDS